MSHAAVALAIVVAVGFVDSASAQSACAKLWYKVAAQGAKATASCHAKAAASGLPVDGTCLALAGQKLTLKWNKAALKGDCPTPADAADAQQVIDAFIANVEDLLTPATVSRCCETGSGCFAGPIIDESSCADLLGTMGAPGSVCSGATGTCVTPPAAAGPCCALPTLSVCTAGPPGDPAGCSIGGGQPHPNAVCDASGFCVAP